ncbi:MAG TPA: hypothetical protein VFX58_14925, partial [Chitinophagaceae bacterium]|nr:hypothetical protein [Chitinophagaceae bacterium]
GTDVILGMGYDNNLDDRLGITLIATGFEHRDPFAKPVPKKEEPRPEEKIVMTLAQAPEERKPLVSVTMPEKKVEEEKPALPAIIEKIDLLAPRLVEELPVIDAPMPTVMDMMDLTIPLKEAEPLILLELQPQENLLSNTTGGTTGINTVEKKSGIEKTESINSVSHSKAIDPVPTGSPALSQHIKETDAELLFSLKDSTSTTHPLPAAAGGYLARPSNIYAESKAEENTSKRPAEEPVPPQPIASKEEEELLELQMQIVERDDIPAADVPMAHQAQPPLTTEVEDPPMADETEEQKRRAAERLQKLRNLSFNVNANDPNNEFETVPAYIRRNMELYNSNSLVENFYSNYEVKKDQNNQTQISTINTFLDGKKPD